MSFNGDLAQRLLNILNVCTRIRSLKTTKPLHALTITFGSYAKQPIFLNNNIISLYVSLDQLPFATKVFDKMPERNPVSFNSIISAYSRLDHVDKAFYIFSHMRSYGFWPTQSTLAGLLSCESLDILTGAQLHALSLKSGLFYADAYVGTTLINLYGRFGLLDGAVQAFNEMSIKSLVTWNSMISLFGQYGFTESCVGLFIELVSIHVSLSESSLVAVFSGLSSEQDLEVCEQLHSLVIKHGFDYAILVANSLINSYARCSNLSLAENIFWKTPVKDVVTWNTIMSAMSKSVDPIKALEYFTKMSKDDAVSANKTTFVSVITSCARLRNFSHGQSLHAWIVKNAGESDVYVGSALVEFYIECDKLKDARFCFDEINQKNVVSWNTLMSGYEDTSVSLLKEMLQSDLLPNEYTFSSILQILSLSELRQIHCLVMKLGYQDNDYVQCSLVTSYAKNGLVINAVGLINESSVPLSVVQSNLIAGLYNRSNQYHDTIELLSMLDQPDIVSWNIVIVACARSNYYTEAVELFKHMHRSGIRPDNYTYVTVLSICSKLSSLALGSSVHSIIIKTDFDRCDTFVCNVLIDMYGKCGNISSSIKIFEETRDKNLITWTALISTHGVHGYVHEAFGLFQEMELLGFIPDAVAFVAMLTVCRHGGLVKEGMELFRKMRVQYGIEPQMDHYHCVVDLLSRHGHLKEAEQVIADMHVPPNALIWRSFLEGCKRYGTADTEYFKCETGYMN